MSRAIPSYEKLGLNWEDYEIALAAEPFYIDLPYHNFGHALNTFNESMRLAEAAEAHDKAVDRRVIGAAALLHDVAFHEPIQDSPFDSKEARSAHIAEYLLSDRYTTAEIAAVKACIMSTKADGSCQTDEERIVVRADIANVDGSFSGFWQNFLNIYWEVLRFDTSGQGVPMQNMVETTVDVIGRYVRRDLSLGDWDRVGGVCPIRLNAERNLAQLRKVIDNLRSR